MELRIGDRVMVKLDHLQDLVSGTVIPNTMGLDRVGGGLPMVRFDRRLFENSDHCTIYEHQIHAIRASDDEPWNYQMIYGGSTTDPNHPDRKAC